MSTYIATFYSHFGAIRFRRELSDAGGEGELLPVPRDLSSSCGTCVRFQTEQTAFSDPHGEVEQIVRCDAEGYTPVYRAENS